MSDTPTFRQKLANRRAFRKAQREANATGGTVCGTYDHDGNPVYFVMPADADPEDVRAKAFELREGRELSPIEHTLIDMAQRGTHADA